MLATALLNAAKRLATPHTMLLVMDRQAHPPSLRRRRSCDYLPVDELLGPELLDDQLRKHSDPAVAWAYHVELHSCLLRMAFTIQRMPRTILLSTSDRLPHLPPQPALPPGSSLPALRQARQAHAPVASLHGDIQRIAAPPGRLVPLLSAYASELNAQRGSPPSRPAAAASTWAPSWSCRGWQPGGAAPRS